MKTETIGDAELQIWSPDEVRDAFNANEIALIDVRTPAEFMFEHIEGALLAPLAWFQPKNLPSQEGKRIVFHCGSGARSEKVARQCLDAGFTSVAHMEGGFAAWKKAGLRYLGTDMTSGSMKQMQQNP
jgi:rhodanese-related sulfurtransferase